METDREPSLVKVIEVFVSGNLALFSLPFVIEIPFPVSTVELPDLAFDIPELALPFGGCG